MPPRVSTRSFAGSVYSLVSAGDSGQEILHIRAVDGDGDNLDLEFDVIDGKILAETLRLKIAPDRSLVVRVSSRAINLTQR